MIERKQLQVRLQQDLGKDTKRELPTRIFYMLEVAAETHAKLLALSEKVGVPEYLNKRYVLARAHHRALDAFILNPTAARSSLSSRHLCQWLEALAHT